MLTTMKVIAGVLCITVPVAKPHKRPAQSDLVQRRHRLAEAPAAELLEVLRKEVHPGKEDAEPADALGQDREHQFAKAPSLKRREGAFPPSATV